MSLRDLVASAVAQAHTLTASLQDTVSHAAYSSQDSSGKPTYATAVNRTALVERKQRLFRTDSGREVLSQAKVTFLTAVTLDTRDQLTLSDGTTGPILSISGLMDPDISKGYYAEVYLG